MGLVGTLSNQGTQERLLRVTERLQRSGSSGAIDPTLRRERLRRRAGSISEAIVTVLASSDGELRVRDIHSAVEALIGESVSASSVKDCLATKARGELCLFERVGRGRYRLCEPVQRAR